MNLQYENTSRKVQCGYIGCRKIFSNEKRLKRHTDGKHLNIKAFNCSFCQAGFIFQEAFDTHLKGNSFSKTAI